MALTKTLETLLERAERKGQATKRVRNHLVMGNYGRTVDTSLVDQWKFTVEHTSQDGQDYKNIFLDHYGTGIAHVVVNMSLGHAWMNSHYGESSSDRDALNGLCEHFGINLGFRYRPSIDKLEVIA